MSCCCWPSRGHEPDRPDQLEAVRLLPGPDGGSPAVPAYAYPESAARALGHAALRHVAGPAARNHPPDLGGLRQDQARDLAASFLAATPAGGWLSREQTAELLGCYGLPLAGSIVVTGEDDTAVAAARFGRPVALKAHVAGLAARRADTGAVLLDLHGTDEVRRGFRSLQETFGGRLTGVIVQPMITGGAEVTIGILEERVFGPLVLFGLTGPAADPLAGRAAPAGAADRHRRRRPDPLGPRRPPAARPRRRLRRRHAAGSPGWPMTCRRSPNWTSARHRPPGRCRGRRRPGPHPARATRRLLPAPAALTGRPSPGWPYALPAHLILAGARACAGHGRSGAGVTAIADG
jgi:ATP-grasp domain